MQEQDIILQEDVQRSDKQRITIFKKQPIDKRNANQGKEIDAVILI